MTQRNLDEMRKKIDDIDSKITALFKERMETSLDIAKYKKEHSLPVFSDRRENSEGRSFTQ